MITVLGPNKRTRKELEEIPIPEQWGASSKWEGIQHGELANTIIETCARMDFKVLGECWYTSGDGAALYGGVDIDPASMGNDLDIGTPTAFSMAIRHSNDMRYALTFGVGARVFLCSNGFMSAEFVLKKRHVFSTHLGEAVEDGINQYVKHSAHLNKIINQIREIEITQEQASHLILQAHRKDLVPFRHLEAVDKTWQKPPHEIFQPRTAWSMYNAFTEVAKQKLSAPKQLHMYRGLYDMFKEVLCLN